MNQDYDYIIAGGGASGLMLAWRLIQSETLRNKRILILDKDGKTQNDRTWCFWEKGKGEWHEIVSHRWPTIVFDDGDFRSEIDMYPFRYKMIRGIDFYKYMFSKLETAANVTFKIEAVDQINDQKDHVEVVTSKSTYTSELVFSSIFARDEIQQGKGYPVLFQHFVGWEIETTEPVFEHPHFMDFSVEQYGNTRFMYVLPYSSRKALVEYTLFSGETLEQSEYEKEIFNYLKGKLNLKKWDVLDKEKGVIPMTTYPLKAKETDRIIHIGTKAGWSKPSTGYTFQNATKYTKQLVEFLEGSRKQLPKQSKRFQYYDHLLLDILERDNAAGRALFSNLFQKNNPLTIFEFLNEETTLKQDLSIILKSPPAPFLKSIIRKIATFK